MQHTITLLNEEFVLSQVGVCLIELTNM